MSGASNFERRPSVHDPSLNYKHVDWSRYAYSLYATDTGYLCNAIMVFESLSRLGSRADRILFYPREWDTEIASTKDRDSQLLVIARDSYRVKLIPVKMPQLKDDVWHGSYAKFLAWQQTQYERVLHIDSDITMLKHMDELFLLPKAPVAMTRAYWDLPEKKGLASLFVLLEPSEARYQQLSEAANSDHQAEEDNDMDVLNRFHGDSAIVLPHRQYGLISSEFRRHDHVRFMGGMVEKWNADNAYKEASLIHFSDSPLPKPWIMWPHQLIGEIIPICMSDRGVEVANCREKEIWTELYNDFRKRRKVSQTTYTREEP